MNIFGIDVGGLAQQGGAFGALCWGLGVLSKSTLDWATGRRKQYMDMLQVSIQQNKDQEEAAEKKAQEQDKKISIMQGQIANMHKAITDLTVTVTRFQDYVDILEQQIVKAGIQPITPAWKKSELDKKPEEKKVVQ